MSEYLNLSQEVLTLNNFEPYLPPFGYFDPSFPDDEMVRLKFQADQEFTPQVISDIYRNLNNNRLITGLDSGESYTIISYGSNIPTHERFLLDLDRQERNGVSHVVSVDWHHFSPAIIRSLTVGSVQYPVGKPYRDDENTHHFVEANNKDFNLGRNSTDLIWQYRSWLYYLLINQNDFSKKIANTRTVLDRHYKELRQNGVIVCDMSDFPVWGRNNFDMSSSTGKLLLEHWNDLGMQDLFSVYEVGTEKSKILVLQKKLE